MHHTTTRIHRRAGVLAALAIGAGAAGCAVHPPPPELVDARAAYARARAGNAAQSEPEELADAKRFLDAAERSQIDQPSAEETRNLAYLAQRKALTAEADAAAASAEVDLAKGLQALATLRPAQLADARNRLDKSEDGATPGGRPPASRSAKEAVDRLSAFAAVSEAPGEMVVTIPDSVLFEGDTAKLMPTARERLERVAQALHEVRGRAISVRGYVDRSGSDARDTELSQRRADAVRAYLVSRGVDQGRARALGLGTKGPVASDASVEGRNQNRRIEIVVEGVGQDPAAR